MMGTGRPFAKWVPEGTRTKDNACVVFDGTKVIYASESERHTHRRHDYETPFLALEAFKDNFFSGGCNLEKLESNDPNVSHHLHHIYEAFYQSGFKEAAVLVNDGRGNEGDCVTFAYMEEGAKPQILKKFSDDNSPCLLYNKAASIVHDHNFAEGKFMGLSAYGRDNGKEYIKFNRITKQIETDEAQLIADLDQCLKGQNKEKGSDPMTAKHVAFTVQDNFENVVVELVKHLKELLIKNGLETENLCLSGGGILNCPANSKIVGLGLFKHYYASPEPSDGCAESVGRGLKLLEEKGEILKSNRLETPYLGATYSIKNSELSLYTEDRPLKLISEELNKGSIIAWYQEGAEFGPRALGHRSFLADPSTTGMFDALNKVKGRESWRPLAPIVPDRLFKLVFDADNTEMCEFMLRTLTIKDQWRDKLKEVCHCDGSTRPQILKRELNPILYDLLMTYFEKTGIPCLVNTSLNINGFPIVETPYDFRCLVEEFYFMSDIPPIKSVLVNKDQIQFVLTKDTK